MINIKKLIYVRFLGTLVGFIVLFAGSSNLFGHTFQQIGAKVESHQIKLTTKSYTLNLYANIGFQNEKIHKLAKWRIYTLPSNKNSSVNLVGIYKGLNLNIALKPGWYGILFTLGRAQKFRSIKIVDSFSKVHFQLLLGAIVLEGTAGDKPINNISDLKFTLESKTFDSRNIEGIKGKEIIFVPQGKYKIEGSYGDYGSKSMTYVNVKAGKLVNVNLKFNAARVSFKLATAKEKFPIANTIWHIYSPGGDLVKLSNIATPRLILPAGLYTVIASYKGRSYIKNIEVTGGEDQNVTIIRDKNHQEKTS